MAGNTGRAGATVASRVLALLAAFDEGHRALGLSELARRAALPPPTAHRLVAELVAGGFIARLPDGRYVVGRRMWDIGLLAPVQSGLRQLASPFLHDLYGATLATVHLAVRDGVRVLYVDRLSGSASVPVVSQVGGRLPLHCTGVGKVLLAYAPAEVQERVLGPPRPHHPVHDHLTGSARGAAAPGAPGRLRPDGRGDEPRRLLGGRARADAVRRGGGPRDRRPEPGAEPAAAGIGAAGLGTRHRALRRGHGLPLGGRREWSRRGGSPLTRPHAHPGRHHRGGAGRPAALPPARPGGDRVRRPRDPVARVRRGEDPRGHPRELDRGPARRRRRGGAAAPGGVRAPRHLPADPGGAPPPRLRRPGGPERLGVRPDGGDQGPGPGPRRGGPAVQVRGDRHPAARPHG